MEALQDGEYYLNSLLGVALTTSEDRSRTDYTTERRSESDVLVTQLTLPSVLCVVVSNGATLQVDWHGTVVGGSMFYLNERTSNAQHSHVHFVLLFQILPICHWRLIGKYMNLV